MSKGETRSGVLVVGPAWVGDMVMAQALFMRLREREPERPVDVVAPAWSLPIIERMPEVRSGIALPLGHGEFGFNIRRRLGRDLRALRYARAIVLPGSWKAALLPFFADIPQRSGYRREFRYGLLNDLRSLDRRHLSQTVQQFVALAEDVDSERASPPEIPTPRLRVDLARGRQRAQELGLDLSKPMVVLMPGAEYGPAKRWPAASFAALARKLVASGRSVWVFGSAKERALGDEIAVIDGVANLCGKTSLTDVVDLLALAQVAVSNDSGLMHVAAAVGTRLVAIYGSSSPGHTPPITKTAEIVYHALDCSPCYQRECPLGHLNCLRGISANEVAARIG